MIVELCGTDLLKLVNGEQVAIKDVIVRPTEADVSSVAGEPVADVPRGGSNRTAAQISSSRRQARAGVTKTGQRWMNALYPGVCYVDTCSNGWHKGGVILYDYDGRRALCPQHGEQFFPNLQRPEGM
jgi:hypothetical protein